MRGRIAGPDPVGSLASLVALGIGVGAFLTLGASIGRDGASARAAVIAGAMGGALAGAAGGIAQAAALSDYLAAVLAGYAVPPEFLAIALGAYVVLATLGAAAIASATSYAGWHRARGRFTR